MKTPKIQNSTTHVYFVTTKAFKMTKQCIKVAVGENSSTSRPLSRMSDLKYVGCHSHQLNVAVQYDVEKHAKLMDKVQYIITQLSNQISTSNLRNYTPWKVRENNFTCSIFTFLMLKRYK